MNKIRALRLTAKLLNTSLSPAILLLFNSLVLYPEPVKLLVERHQYAGTEAKAETSLQYFGLKPPGNTPVLLANGFITTQQEHEFGAVFSETGDEFFFGVDLGSRTEIRTSVLNSDGWSKPQPVIFDAKYSFNDPFLTADGQKLFYISNMPLDKTGPAKDYDIWYSIREENGWSEPVNAGEKINTQHHEYFVSFTLDGKIYFSSNRDPSSGFDIYSSQWLDGQFSTPVKLPDAVNSSQYDADVFVAADESYLVFSSVRSNGQGKGDLYISFNLGDSNWSEAESLAQDVNTEGHELCPFVTADGKYMLFTRNGDIYWMQADFSKKINNNDAH
jgi:hypothetical protein